MKGLALLGLCLLVLCTFSAPILHELHDGTLHELIGAELEIQDFEARPDSGIDPADLPEYPEEVPAAKKAKKAKKVVKKKPTKKVVKKSVKKSTKKKTKKTDKKTSKKTAKKTSKKSSDPPSNSSPTVYGKWQFAYNEVDEHWSVDMKFPN